MSPQSKLLTLLYSREAPHKNEAAHRTRLSRPWLLGGGGESAPARPRPEAVVEQRTSLALARAAAGVQEPTRPRGVVGARESSMHPDTPLAGVVGRQPAGECGHHRARCRVRRSDHVQVEAAFPTMDVERRYARTVAPHKARRGSDVRGV